MKKLQFKISIASPVSKVFDLMLGLSNKSTYEAWTALFNPTSSFEGTWENGSKMLFIGIDENGEKGGIISKVAENIPNQFVSLHHYGLYKAGEEITDGPEVEKWANGYENYTFEDNKGSTSLIVDIDVTEEYESYFNNTYPTALNKLKEICEE